MSKLKDERRWLLFQSKGERKTEDCEAARLAAFVDAVLKSYAEEKTTRHTRKPIVFQVERLRKLEDGWYENNGAAPSDEGLDWLLEVFGKWYAPDLDQPQLYPMFDGGVQAEWMLGRFDLSLEIDLEKKSGWFHGLNLDTRKEESGDLLLDRKSGWDILQRLIEESREIRNETEHALASAGTRSMVPGWEPNLSSISTYGKRRRPVISI